MTDQVREAGRGHAQARYNRQIAAMPLTWSCAATQGLPGTPTRAGKANYPNNTSDATSTMFNLHVPSRASIDRGTALHAPNEISQAEECGMQVDLALQASRQLPSTDQVWEASRGHAQARYDRQIAAMPTLLKGEIHAGNTTRTRKGARRLDADEPRMHAAASEDGLAVRTQTLDGSVSRTNRFLYQEFYVP